ncbi:MAG: hypothetical protein WC508_03330 [Patescibacteria group bacterium]
MDHLRRTLNDLAERGKHFKPNGCLHIQICLSGNPNGPFEQKLNNAFLAAAKEERLEIFRRITQLWHTARFEKWDSPDRREAEAILGTTLCRSYFGRASEVITATITSDNRQIRVWHGLPQSLGSESVDGAEKPLFSISHPSEPNEVVPYFKIITNVLLKESQAKGKNSTLQEILLSNGTKLMLIIQA